MAMKIKGIYKSFKFISQIFVVKEREMEIGHPTDVKHVAHIGWDSPSITGPSWMNEFRTSPNLATSSDNTGEPRVTNPIPLTTTWSNQDTEESIRSKPTSFNSSSSHHHRNASKKNKSRKTKSTSSTRSSSSSSSIRQSRESKSKLTFSEATPTIQV